MTQNRRFVTRLRSFFGIGIAWTFSWGLLAGLVAGLAGAEDLSAVLVFTIVGSNLGLPGGLAFGVLIVATDGGRGIEAVTARRAALLGAIAGTVVPFGFLALTDPLRTTEPAPLVLGDLGEVLLICAVLAGLGATTGLAMRAVAKRLAP